jgi:hypothetical protein
VKDPEEAGQHGHQPENVPNIPERQRKPELPNIKPKCYLWKVRIGAADVYIPHDMPRLDGSQRYIFGHMETNDEVARSASAEKAEVEVQAQAQGAASGSDDGGDVMDGSSNDGTTSNVGCGTRYTTPKMLAEEQCQQAGHVKTINNGLPVMPIPHTHYAQCPNGLYQPRHRCG